MRIEARPSLARDQRGLSTVEYTVLLVLIVACTVGLWQKFGQSVVAKLQGSQTEFDKAQVVSH
jgi:Flp pilus assembly pilin Flp